MQSRVDIVSLVTYEDVVPAERRSPIPLQSYFVDATNDTAATPNRQALNCFIAAIFAFTIVTFANVYTVCGRVYTFTSFEACISNKYRHSDEEAMTTGGQCRAMACNRRVMTPE